MTDSFVFYKSFYKSICLLESDSEKWEMIQCMCELAFNGTDADESQFTDMQKVIYYITEKQIQASVQHKIDGAKGGRPKKITGVKTPLFTPEESVVKSNANVNVNVNDNVNVNVNNSGVNAANPYDSKLNKSIFTIFKDANLPCANNNEISFLMSDYRNAMGFIHSSSELKNLHSDDLIQACKNYVSVLNDSECWVQQKMNFYSLVKSKLFYNLLPQNFVFENYKTVKQQEKKSTSSIRFDDAPCPSCKEQKLIWKDKNQKFVCSLCHTQFTWEEVYS